MCISLEVGKPGQQTFCNFSQLPLSNSLFTVLFAYFVCFACFVVRDLCRHGCRQNYYFTSPPPPPHNSLFNTSDSYLLVAVPFSCLLLDIGHLEKGFPESLT